MSAGYPNALKALKALQEDLFCTLLLASCLAGNSCIPWPGEAALQPFLSYHMAFSLYVCVSVSSTLTGIPVILGLEPTLI